MKDIPAAIGATKCQGSNGRYILACLATTWKTRQPGNEWNLILVFIWSGAFPSLAML